MYQPLEAQNSANERRREAAGLNDGPLPDNGQPGFVNDTSWGALWDTAREQEDLLTNYFRNRANIYELEDDEDFEWTDELASQVMEGLPEETWGFIFQKANSTEQAWAARELALDSAHRQESLQEAGWRGVAASMGAVLADPVGLVASVLAPASTTQRASRLVRAGHGAIAGGGSNAALEAALVHEKPTGTGADILMSASLGAILGGGFSAALPTRGPDFSTKADPFLGRPGSRTTPETVHTSEQMRAERFSDSGLMESAEAARQRYATSAREIHQSSVLARRWGMDDSDVLEAIREHKATLRSVRDGTVADDPDLVQQAGLKLSRVEYKELSRQLDEARTKEAQTPTKPGTRDVDRHLEALRASPGEARSPARKLKERARAAAQDEIQEQLNRARAERQALEERLNQAERARSAQLELERRRQAALAQSREQIAGMTGENRLKWIEQRTREVAARRLKEHREAQEPQVIKVPEVFQGDNSVGAAEVRGYIRALGTDSDELIDAAVNAPYSAMAQIQGIPLRYDASGVLGNSDLDSVRLLNFRLNQEATGGTAARGVDAEKVALEESAGEWGNRTARRMEASMWRTVLPAFRQWLKDHGMANKVPAAFRPFKLQEFSKEVTAYIRDHEPGTAHSFDPNVARAGEALRSLYEQYVDLLLNPGVWEGRVRDAVKGAENIVKNAHYFPRIRNSGAWQYYLQQLGDNGLERLFAKAFQNANPQLDDGQAMDLGRLYFRNASQAEIGGEVEFAQRWDGIDLDGLEVTLRQEGFSEDLIETILSNARAARTKEGSPADPRLKRKSLLDENTSMVLPTRDGSSMQVIVKDLFEQDAIHLFMLYNRQMAGRIALSRAGIGDDTAKNRWFQAIRDEARKKGIDPEPSINRLEFTLKMISGKPIDNNPGSVGAGLGRMLLDYNFIRLMAQAGFAQLSEVGNLMAELGVTSTLRSLPSLRDVMRDAQSMRLRDPLLDELEEVTAVGTDLLRSQIVHRTDEFGNPYFWQYQSPWLRNVDTGLQAGKKAVNMLSMGPVNDFLHRWGVRSISQRYAEIAFNKKNAVGFEGLLMHSGLNAEELEAVLEQIRKHSEGISGETGRGRLTRLNLDKWDDAYLAERFGAAIERHSATLIQETRPGNIAPWMGTLAGRLLTQFRSFMLVSWSKHALRHMNHRQARNFGAMMASGFAGMMGYTLQSYVKAVGRDDPQGYLEHRLSHENLAKAWLERSSWSSLVPMVIDSLAANKVFKTRSTGLSADLMGNPTLDLVESLFDAQAGVRASLLSDDYQFSQEDLRAIMRAMPFQTAVGVDNTFQAILSELPARSDPWAF